MAALLDRDPDVLRHQDHAGREHPPASVERGVVERGRAPVDEADRARGELAADLDEREPEDPDRQELLREPPEEDLHAGHHEHALRTLAEPVQLHEPVEQRPDGLRVGRDDPVGPGFGLELRRLALDLVPELRRQAREVRVPRRRERQERRDAVLILRLLDLEPGVRRRIAQRRQPRVVLAQPAEVGARPIVPIPERLEQGTCGLLAHRRETDRPHVVGHLRPPEEPEHVPHPFERDRGAQRPVVLLGEAQEQVLGRLAELLPVELQVGRPMEERPASGPPRRGVSSPVAGSHDRRR